MSRGLILVVCLACSPAGPAAMVSCPVGVCPFGQECVDGVCESCVEAGCPQQVMFESALGNRIIDLLYVIGNRATMGGAQEVFAKQLPLFEEALRGQDGILPDLHVGVISTDLGDGQLRCSLEGDHGRLQNAARRPHCQPPAGFFASVEVDDLGQEVKNYPGTLAEALDCIVPLGTDGCEVAQPVGAVLRFFDGSNPENVQFPRYGNTTRGIVFVSDVDDCSALDPAVFDPAVTLGYPPFRCAALGMLCDGMPVGVEPGPRHDCHATGGYSDLEPGYFWDPEVILPSAVPQLFAAAAGPVEPVVILNDLDLARPRVEASCLGPAAEGFPAVRLGRLAGQRLQSICDARWETLRQFHARLGEIAEARCLTQLWPRDPEQSCAVVDVVVDGGGETTLPPCSTGAGAPCWRVEPNDLCDSPRSSLEIERLVPPAPRTYLRVTCRGP
jgi:hypothetical protein